MSTDKRNQLKTRIALGFWEDMEGAIHVSIPELCEVVGLEYNEENRLKIVDMLMDQAGSKTRMIYRSSPEDKGQEL